MNGLDKSAVRREFFSAGMAVIEQGGRSGRLYVLKEGEVEVVRDGTFITAVRQPGAIFGEMSLLLERPYSATVRALTPVEVLVVDDALNVLTSRPDWTLQIARLLAQRVDATTARLTAAEQDVHGGRLVLPQTVMSSWADPQV